MLQHLILPSNTTTHTIIATITIVATLNHRSPTVPATHDAPVRPAIATHETVPRNHQHAQNPRRAAEHEGHDAARREAGGQAGRRARLAGQIEKIGVAGGVADSGGG